MSDEATSRTDTVVAAIRAVTTALDPLDAAVFLKECEAAIAGVRKELIPAANHQFSELKCANPKSKSFSVAGASIGNASIKGKWAYGESFALWLQATAKEVKERSKAEQTTGKAVYTEGNRDPGVVQLFSIKLPGAAADGDEGE